MSFLRAGLAVLVVVALLHAPFAAAQCMVPSTGETGGDGYFATFSSSLRIYNVYHHTSAQVVCLDPIAGTVCAGTPISVVGNAAGASGFYLVMTPPDFDGQVMLNGRYLFFTATGYTSAATNYPTWCIFCFDTLAGGSGSYCTQNGGVLQINSALITVPPGLYNGVGDPTPGAFGGSLIPFPGGVPNHFITVGGDLALYCVVLDGNTGAMSLCPPPTPYPLTTPLGSHTSFFQPLLKVIGTQVFMTYQDQSNTYVTCYDFSVLSLQCSGITGPTIIFAGNPSLYNSFFTYTTALVATHICTSFWDQAGQPSVCVSLTTGVVGGLPAYITAPAVFAGLLSTPAVISTRSYFGIISMNTVSCYDWVAQAQCPSINPANTANYYYTLTVDPDNCIWGLSDNHFSLNFDINGNSPCLAAPHGIANPDFSLFNYSLPCGFTVFGDVLANDANIFPSSLAVIPPLPVGTASEFGSMPYELQWIPPSCNWVGTVTINYRVCSDAWSTSSVTSQWYIVANPGPQVKPGISYNVVDFQSTTVYLSDWISAGVFPIDYSSFQLLTQVPPQIGWVTYNPGNPSGPSITFLPNRNLDSPLSITTQICDNPGTIGSPPITIPRVCKNTVVTFVPYFVHWESPNLVPFTFWYMYWPAYIQWSSNLPQDFALQFSLTKYPSGAYVSIFALPLSDVSGNTTWTPHNMLPGKYQLTVTSYGNSIPVFNNYVWPGSGVVQLRIKPAKDLQ